jgi:4-aminobutyrate aminotransferase-like enzyme
MNNVARIPNAYCYRCPLGAEYPSCGIQCAEYVRTFLERGMEPVIAVMLEPTMYGLSRFKHDMVMLIATPPPSRTA